MTTEELIEKLKRFDPLTKVDVHATIAREDGSEEPGHVVEAVDCKPGTRGQGKRVAVIVALP